MSLFNHIEFVTSVDQLRDLPPARGAEVAFVGRSNAGKSSAINSLGNRKRLAYVAKAPGKTRLINFFHLGEGRYLVDLPGYGYARGAAGAREHWSELIEGYLTTRASLKGLALVMDIRHPLTALDRQLLEWFAPTGKPVHVLLSKADKLGRVAMVTVLREVSAALAAHYPNCSAQLFSSRTHEGVEQAKRVIADWIGVDVDAGVRQQKAPGQRGVKPGAKLP